MTLSTSVAFIEGKTAIAGWCHMLAGSQTQLDQDHQIEESSRPTADVVSVADHGTHTLACTGKGR